MGFEFLDAQVEAEEQPKDELTKLEFAGNVVRAIAQGLSFGFADEAEAYARSVLTDEGYEDALENARSGLEQLREESPIIGYGAEIAGSLPYGLAGAGLRFGARKLGQEAVESALSGTTAKYLGASGAGGLYGAGAAEEGERLGAAITGGALGAGLQKVSPVVTEQAKALLKRGVPLTIGQSLGGAVKRFEEAASSIPLAGSVIRSAQARAGERFNVEAINEALEPLGKKVKFSKDKVGTETFVEADEIISEAYTKALKGVEVDVPMSADELIEQIGKDLPTDQKEIFAKIIRKDVGEILRIRNNRIDGEDYKAIISSLKNRIYDYAMKGDPRDEFLVDAIKKVSFELRDLVDDQFPEVAGQLAKVDKAHSRFVPIKMATAYAEPTEGVFSPAQLQRAIKADRGKEKAFSRGELPLQQTARAGRATIGKELPDSGTATRGIVSSALMSAAGGAPFGMPLEAGILGGLGGALYTRPAQAILRGSAPYVGAVGRAPATSGLLAQETPRLDITLDDISATRRSLLGLGQ